MYILKSMIPVSAFWATIVAFRLLCYMWESIVLQSNHIDSVEELTLCGLQPYTQYKFSVQCRPRGFHGKVTGFWSQPVYINVTTEEDGKVQAWHYHSFIFGQLHFCYISLVSPINYVLLVEKT